MLDPAIHVPVDASLEASVHRSGPACQQVPTAAYFHFKDALRGLTSSLGESWDEFCLDSKHTRWPTHLARHASYKRWPFTKNTSYCILCMSRAFGRFDTSGVQLSEV